MALSKDHYLQHFRGLLPPGPAWPRDKSSLITLLLETFAGEFARIDARIDALLSEADPRTTLEMLVDWERLCGLPDACTGPVSSISLRRGAVVARLSTIGGQSRAFYKALAASLGYQAEVTEERVHTCMSSCVDPVNNDPWAFVWNLIVQATNVPRYFTCVDECITPLQVWGDELLECVIERVAPAHTLVRFAYI